MEASVRQETEIGRAVCLLETIGRSSRLPRRLEIWYALEGDRVYLLSGGRDRSHWVRNLRAEPRVRVALDGRWREGRGRIIDDPDDPDGRAARELLAAKYQAWAPGRPLSAWARSALPVVIDLSK